MHMSARIPQAAPRVYLQREQRAVGLTVEEIDIQRAAVPAGRGGITDGFARFPDLRGAVVGHRPDTQG
jgi:hypothetical protein